MSQKLAVGVSGKQMLQALGRQGCSHRMKFPVLHFLSCSASPQGSWASGEPLSDKPLTYKTGFLG